MRRRFDEITEEIERMVLDAKEIAVLGLSSQPQKPSHYASKYLQDQGYDVIPININQFVDRILDEKVYRDLMSVPYDYDILLVFRPSNEIPEITNAYFSAPHQAPLVWFQQGIFDQESFDRIEAAGFRCVMDKCLMTEHMKIIDNIGYEDPEGSFKPGNSSEM
jgi:hypothetical protein